MTEHVQVGGLQVAKVLFDFVNNEAIPGTGITADQFWAGADKVGVNTSAVNNPSLVDAGAKAFGSQCIVVAIDAKREGHDAKRRRRNRPHGRPATRGAGHECPFRAQCLERPLGFAV